MAEACPQCGRVLRPARAAPQQQVVQQVVNPAPQGRGCVEWVFIIALGIIAAAIILALC